MRAFWLSLTLLTASTFCVGQSVDPCKNQSNTHEINECGRLTLKSRDRDLNQAYQALMKSLRANDKEDNTNYAEVKKKLQEAQRAWIVFRDNDCQAKYTLWESGTIRGITHLSCLTERTEQRTKELRTWVD